MKSHQMADLLNLISSTDGRNLTQQMPVAWMEIIGDLDFEDSKAAVVEHFQSSTEWLMPAHVRAGVKRIREKRIVAAGPVDPSPVDSDDDYLRVRRSMLDAAASGRVTAEQFRAYRKSGIPWDEWTGRELAA